MNPRIVELSSPKENKVNFQLLWEQVSESDCFQYCCETY